MRGKYMLIVLFSTLGYCGFSQKMKLHKEIDKFTGKYRVETTPITMYQWVTVSSAINVKLRSNDTLYFIHFMGSTSTGIIDEDDPLILLLDDKSTITIYPTSFQSYDVETGGNTFYNHQYNISKDQLQILSTKKVISFRRYFNDHYSDFDVKTKWAERFAAGVNLFLQNI
jgi:hypothetical protein